eukprot:GHVS01055391.1.p1 GENE.GHVS01055391.1~~GHVS01055391.1.p1  ORF type:complete len:293 (-),score=61.47 GHVS01055391.1:538-1386(-)
MVAKCDYLPYLKLSEEKLSELWNERQDKSTDIFTWVLDKPLDVEGFKAIESVYIEAFKVFSKSEDKREYNCKKGLLKFHTKETIWKSIITRVDSSYLIAGEVPYVAKRETADMRKVETLLQKALNLDDKAFLPAFAVTRFIPTAVVKPEAAAAAAEAAGKRTVDEVICLVRPVVKQLIKVHGKKEAFQPEDDVMDWVYRTPKDALTKTVLVDFTLKGKKQKAKDLDEAKNKAEEEKGEKEAEKKLKQKEDEKEEKEDDKGKKEAEKKGGNEGEKEEAPKGQD